LENLFCIPYNFLWATTDYSNFPCKILIMASRFTQLSNTCLCGLTKIIKHDFKQTKTTKKLQDSLWTTRCKACVTEFGSQASQLVEYWKLKLDCQVTKQRSSKCIRSFLQAALQLIYRKNIGSLWGNWGSEYVNHSGLTFSE